MFERGGHAGTYRLVQTLTGTPVEVGCVLTSFRGETYVLNGGMAPHKDGSEGRVWARPVGHSREDEFFPSVFGLKWLRILTPHEQERHDLQQMAFRSAAGDYLRSKGR